MIRLSPKQFDRFMAKVVIDASTGCWLWNGALGGGGYPVVSLYDRNHAAHRVIYEHHIGPIGDGLQLDHLCRVRRCVNPKHVEPVTPRENTMRGNTPAAINAAKTHCPKGHELSGRNLYVPPRGGERMCAECRRQHVRAYRARKHAA